MGDKRTIIIGREKITFDDEISKTLTDEYGITPNLGNNEGDNAVTWPWRKGESSLFFPGNTTLHDEHIVNPYPAPRLAIPHDRDWERRYVTKEIIKRFINSLINQTMGQKYNCIRQFEDTDYYIHEFEREDGNGYVFVRADGKGVVTCKKNNGWGWIHSLSVLKPYRRQGICGQLLAKVEEYFQQRGINQFYLTCSSDWHIKCYKKYGYVVTGDREGVDKGSVKMMKQLSSKTAMPSPTPSRRSLFDAIKSFIHKFIHLFIKQWKLT